jgi:hypothetical protein
VTQDNDQGAAEHAHPVLDATERSGVDGVASIADDEQLAPAAPEEQLGGNAAVGTAN